LQVPPDVAAKAAHRWERRSAAFIENVAKLLRDMPEAKKNPVDHAMVRAADRAVSKRAGNLPRGGAKLSELHLLPDVQRQAGSIVSRLAHWDEIAEQGGTPPRGVLLYGPPGTGKTHLINAIARELGDWHVFEVRTAEILADPRSFTKVIELATAHRPAFVFIDEADDLLKDRNASFNATATNEILKAMDGAIGAIPEVVFVAATNNPEAIDAAAKRSGRFSEKLLLDVFRGDDLVRFVSNWIDANGGRLNLDASVTAEGIAACIGAAGPADVIGILNTAVNATFDGSQGAGLRRSVVLSDIERATHELRAV
jgi:transitional endoplasmic reticulum ATPase